MAERPLQGERYPYVYVDGIYLRRNWGGEFENVAIAVNEDGYREVLGAAEGMKEDKSSGCVAMAWTGLNWWLATSALGFWKLWAKRSPRPSTKGVPSTFTTMYSQSRLAPR